MSTAIKLDIDGIVTEDVLRRTFSRFGEVTNVRLFYTHYTEPFAVVIFVSEESAEKARAIKELKLGNAVIKVS